MTIRPGARIFPLMGALILIALISFAWGKAAWLALPVATAALAVGILDYRGIRVAMRKIDVRRVLPNIVGRNARFDWSMAVRNSGDLPIQGELRDVLPIAADPPLSINAFGAAPGETVALGGQLRIPIRGQHQFGPVWLRVKGSFGMLEAQRSFECPGAVKVLPESAVSKETLSQSALSEQKNLSEKTRSRLRGEGMEFESLAEFRQGDDPRHIDWRSSAKQRRLVVRRFQIEQHRDVVILIDCGRLMAGEAGGGGSKLDRAVDAAVMLSHVALQRGDRCGLGMFDDKVIGYLPPAAGGAAYRILLESLYNVQSRWKESNFAAMFATLQARLTKRALVVVISDIADASTSEQFRAALSSISRRHLLIFAALRTPLLSEIVNAPVDSMVQVSQKAVTFRLLRERERALFSLTRLGINVLDVEPSQLTVPLINRYIELRDRNLL